MTAIILKLLVRFIKLLESNQSPYSLSIGFAFGVMIGLPDLNSIYHGFFLIIFSLFSISFIAGFFGFSIGSLLSYAMTGIAHSLGVFFLSEPMLLGLWTWLTNAPILSLLNFHHSITCGFYMIGLILCLPLIFGLKKAIVLYRVRWRQKIESHPLFKLLRLSKFGRWVYSIVRAVA